jgi:penicillin amidase
MRSIAALLACTCVAGCTGNTPPPDASIDAARIDAGPDCHADPTADGCPLPADPTYAGPSASIEVIRDTMFIPHLYAANDEDAYYASGYLQATDRLFEMDLTRRHALGRRAEVLGAGAYNDDETIRLFDLPRWAELSRRNLLINYPDLYRLLVAWCAGVNARIDEIARGAAPMPYGFGPSELNYMPEHWAPIDAQAVGTMIMFGNAEQIEYDALSSIVHSVFPTLEQRVRFLAPAETAHTLPPEERPPSPHPFIHAPTIGDTTPPVLDAGFADRLTAFFDRFRAIPLGASNNWAIDGSHTASGHPLIAGDPHQGLQSPSLMWTHHMNSTLNGHGTLDVIGFNFVGTPSIELGHNAHVAWTATTTYPDWNDLWGVNTSATSINYGGQSYPIVMRREEIRVAGEATPRVLTVEDVPALPGLLIPDSFFPLPLYPGRRVLMRWAGMQASTDAVAFHRMDTATSTADYEAAVDLGHLAAFNFVAADANGITYRSPPWVPIRADVPTVMRSPNRILDGDDVGSMWTGRYLTPDVMPHSHGGVRGWIATANDEPYGFLDDGSIFGDPFYFGAYFDPGWRAQRVENEVTRLCARGAVTRDDMVTLQGDTTLLIADDLIPPLLAAWDARATDPMLAPYANRTDLAALVEGLRAWDHHMDRSSPDAVVFNAYVFELAKEVIADDMGILFDPIMGQSPTYLMKLLIEVVRDTSAMGDSFFQAGRTYLTVRALDDVASYLMSRFGSTDRAQYTWGAIHGTRFGPIWSPASGAAALDGGWISTDGSLGTIHVGESQFFDSMRQPLMRLESGGGSIYRMAAQFRADGTPDAVVTIPRGISGEPTSPHFADLQTAWQQNQPQPLLFLRADVDAAATDRFTIPAHP